MVGIHIEHEVEDVLSVLTKSSSDLFTEIDTLVESVALFANHTRIIFLSSSGHSNHQTIRHLVCVVVQFASVVADGFEVGIPAPEVVCFAKLAIVDPFGSEAVGDLLAIVYFVRHEVVRLVRVSLEFLVECGVVSGNACPTVDYFLYYVWIHQIGLDCIRIFEHVYNVERTLGAESEPKT